VGKSTAQEASVQDEPSVEDDEAVAPPNPPPYDQRAVPDEQTYAPYDRTAVPDDQTATEDALETVAEPPPVDTSDGTEPEPEVEPPAEAGPSANGEARSSDDTGPLDAPVGPVAPIGPGGTNGYGYDYGDQPLYAEAPVYGDPSGYGDQPVYDGAPVPTGHFAYGEAPGDELAYGDQLAYGSAPVPTDQLTYGEAPAYGEPSAFGEAPVADAPFGEAPFGEAPFGEAPFGEAPYVAAPPVGVPFGDSPFAPAPVVAPPWPQPEVPAGPVLLPPPTGTPRRGVRSISRPKSKRPQTRKGRRVKRVVRRIELWSVLKVSLLFYFCMYLVALAASALLWGFAYSAGLIENFESFMADIGFDDFQFFGDQLFKEVAIVGAILVVAGALLTVLAIALVNVISEVTGGVRFVVIEIDADERPSARQP
jgi:hypothetical protein